MKYFIVTAYLIILSMTNANAKTCLTLEALNSFIGEWVQENDDGKLLEKWRQVSRKSFEGIGQEFNVSGKIKSVETLRLVEMSNEVFYIAKANGNKFPTAFKLTHCSTDKFVFENSEHDFPQKLIYHFTSTDDLKVSVLGGNNEGFEIIFKRLHQEN